MDPKECTGCQGLYTRVPFLTVLFYVKSVLNALVLYVLFPPPSPSSVPIVLLSPTLFLSVTQTQLIHMHKCRVLRPLL